MYLVFECNLLYHRVCCMLCSSSSRDGPARFGSRTAQVQMCCCYIRTSPLHDSYCQLALLVDTDIDTPYRRYSLHPQQPATVSCYCYHTLLIGGEYLFIPNYFGFLVTIFVCIWKHGPNKSVYNPDKAKLYFLFEKN